MVKDDYEHYKYIFRVNPINSAKQANALIDFISGKLKGDLGLRKIAILGENAKWVQDMVPSIKKGAEAAGLSPLPSSSMCRRRIFLRSSPRS
jgi:branched-chain amino acid transport system substrate-binding protein